MSIIPDVIYEMFHLHVWRYVVYQCHCFNLYCIYFSLYCVYVLWSTHFGHITTVCDLCGNTFVFFPNSPARQESVKSHFASSWFSRIFLFTKCATLDERYMSLQDKAKHEKLFSRKPSMKPETNSNRSLFILCLSI